MSTTRAPSRAAAFLAILGLLAAGCLSFDVPSPAPTPSAPSGPPPQPTAGTSHVARPNGELVVAVPEDPSGFILPASDDTTALLVDLLYDPLYRLDEHLVPQPALAAALPSVDAAGTTWTIELTPGGRFADGSPVTAADAAFSLRLAASAECPLGRDLCDATSANLTSAVAKDPTTLSVVLQQPFSPFLGEVLAQLPIVSAAGVRAGVQDLLTGARAVPADAPGKQVRAITDATNADACLTANPPFGCRLADHAAELEKTLHDAGLAPPTHAEFTGPTGDFDAEAYAGVVLDRVASLDQLLTTSGDDQAAAALGLLDLTQVPVGGGPYRLDGYEPGKSIELSANPGHTGGAPQIDRIRLAIVRDPSVATTRLLTGDVDWVLDVSPDQVPTLHGAAGVTLGGRPLPAQRAIVFNVRPGRVYADPAARHAFALCLDRNALAGQATAGAAVVAQGPVAPDAWAMPAASPQAGSTTGAVQALQAAGWVRGSDGIFARNGQRLASSIAVRPSRADLLTFAQQAAAQLATCGIELNVEQLDLTGDQLLSQLQWPNDFDTVLISRTLGTDPDHDVQAFESRHATSADDPADANPGGYTSSTADRLIAAARATTDRAERTGLYAQLAGVLASDLPAWPIWYDVGWSAVDSRVRAGNGGVDPSGPRFWWNLPSWTLRNP